MLGVDTSGGDIGRANVAQLSSRLSAGVYIDKEKLNELLDQRDLSEIKKHIKRNKTNIEVSIKSLQFLYISTFFFVPSMPFST